MDGQPALHEALVQMSEAMAHRGPDGEGQLTMGPIGLGHRRLSIQDLSKAGRQPMQTADGRYTLSYNGEVYNFKELRKELEKLGHAFQSTSDSEVVLYAFAQWGEACLERFNGMFAFAIWDNQLRRLFLARDRYGIKPLYYTINNRLFLFGSEQKAILAHPSMERRFDYEALLEYFTFQNIFTDKTFFKDIKLFPAGHHAWVTPDDARITMVCYWDYHFQEPDNALPEVEYIDELDRLFQQAVKRQLVADVDVSAYLSGGLDSGAITAIAASQVPYIKSFTCGFDLSSASGFELSFDERDKAEAMSARFKTEHYEMVLKAGDMERCLPALTHHLEEPRVGQCYPNYYAAKLASKFGKVVLAGTGGDELFGGYPWRYYRVAVNQSFENYIDKYYLYWQRLIPNTVIRKVFSPIWSEVKGVWTRDIFRDVFASHANELRSPEDYINHSLYFEAKTFLHGLLMVEDKLSMAHGLENRVPFLDNDLVDFSLSLPVRHKLANLHEVVRISENEPGKVKKYYKRTRDGKLLLRKVMARHIPGDIANGTKQGFSAPDSSWFRGDSVEYVKDLLIKNKNALIYNFFDTSAVQELILEHLHGKENRRLLIWSLLNFEHWCDTFIN
jgi:asparagine synthase (glutamine-hydrolysing)